jgi:hypothetical protein
MGTLVRVEAETETAAPAAHTMQAAPKVLRINLFFINSTFTFFLAGQPGHSGLASSGHAEADVRTGHYLKTGN